MKSRNTRIVISNKFLSSWGYALHFCWSNLMITGNFSNSAAQFLLVGACGYAHSIPCFQDDLSVFKAFTSKVFKCPNKKVFFEWQVYLLNSFVPFQKQIKQPYHIELHLSCSRVSGSTPVFSTMDVRLSGCLATCSLVVPALALLPEESRNYHVLRVLILSCQIFHIYDNYSVVWLFHLIIIVYFSVYDNFCSYTGKEKKEI